MSILRKNPLASSRNGIFIARKANKNETGTHGFLPIIPFHIHLLRAVCTGQTTGNKPCARLKQNNLFGYEKLTFVTEVNLTLFCSKKETLGVCRGLHAAKVRTVEFS